MEKKPTNTNSVTTKSTDNKSPSSSKKKSTGKADLSQIEKTAATVSKAMSKSSAGPADKSVENQAAKNTKNNSSAKSDLGSIITKAAGSASAVRALGNGKSKTTKKLLSIVSVIVMIVIIASGGLYYFDIPPFNFDFSNSFGKYYSGGSTYSDGDLRVHFIDVGQGDCIFIELPDKKTMVIDGGKDNKTTETHIVDYISDIIGKNAEIDYLMLTHTDSDHSGGIDAIFDNFEIKRVYMPFTPSGVTGDPVLMKLTELGVGTLFNNNYYVETGVYKKFVERVITEGSEVYFSFDSTNVNNESKYNNGKSCDIIESTYSIKFYSPSLDFYLKSMSSAANKNNVSPMIILNFNNKSILLTGDADDDAEIHFLASTPSNTRDIDFLKVAHHGGQQSTSLTFLQAVTPAYSIISVGSNSYGHPTAAVLDRISSVKSNCLRTDVKGNIILTINSNGASFKCTKTNENFGDSGEYESSKLIWLKLLAS